MERICSYDRLQAVLDLYYKIMGKLNNFLMCKNDLKAQSRCPTIWFHYSHFLFSMRQSFKETIRAINRAAQCLNKDVIGDYSTLTTLFLCECLRILSVICCILVSSSSPKRQMKYKIKHKTKQKLCLRYIPICVWYREPLTGQLTLELIAKEMW